MAAICNRSQSFHQYLVDWDQYIQKNNLTDWFDDEPDLKADGFEIVVKKIRTKKTKTPCFRGKLYKWVESSSGGFGFIMPEKKTRKEDSIWVHISEVYSKPKVGANVSFEIVKGKKGLTAKKVRLV